MRGDNVGQDSGAPPRDRGATGEILKRKQHIFSRPLIASGAVVLAVAVLVLAGDILLAWSVVWSLFALERDPVSAASEL